MKTATLGDRIREARGALTQDQLADRIRARRPKLKLSGVRISRYERDVQAPRLSVIVAIAEATDRPLDFFRVDTESDGGEQSLSGDDEEDDQTAMLRAAYHLDRAGEFVLADDLRLRARKAKFSAIRHEKSDSEVAR
jgi:transcriptional regulator with XRE-family HTH domain